MGLGKDLYINIILFIYLKSPVTHLLIFSFLGKTIQIIVYILILYKERKCYPFLVVAPKSTTAGWSREFKRWARELNVIEYHGDRESMKVVEDLEMFPDGTNLKCHVVITTSEAIQQHTNTFLKVPLWEALVVDEAHSLKRGQESLLFKTLITKFNVYHKVLLTGSFFKLL
jgi:SWI/SNF-related matrix-associated actin-dependent regulator of chromatin subfamily A member 5